MMNSLISNLQRPAVLLGRLLARMMRSRPHVVENDQAVLSDLQKFQLHEDRRLGVVGVDGHYPSITHQHFLQILERAVLGRWASCLSYAEWITNLSRLILSSHSVLWDRRYFQVLHGLGTGSTCAAQFANVLLAELDEHTLYK